MWNRRPTWELSNMVRALETFQWLNTEEDTQRLEIAKEILKERKSEIVTCKGCDEEVAKYLLSGIELCPPCTGKWVKAATS